MSGKPTTKKDCPRHQWAYPDNKSAGRWCLKCGLKTTRTGKPWVEPERCEIDPELEPVKKKTKGKKKK